MVVSSASWQILYSVPAELISLILLSDFRYNDIISETNMNKAGSLVGLALRV